MAMQRLDPETLVIHLGLALATAPQRTLEDFRAADGYHPRATTELARHLASRLAGLDISIGENWVDPEAQRSLFNGKC